MKGEHTPRSRKPRETNRQRYEPTLEVMAVGMCVKNPSGAREAQRCTKEIPAAAYGNEFVALGRPRVDVHHLAIDAQRLEPLANLIDVHRNAPVRRGIWTDQQDLHDAATWVRGRLAFRSLR